MMSATTTFPYTFQPQPPSHPKTTGGKQGPSTQQLLISSDEDIKSVSDHSPPIRLTSIDVSTTWPKIKTGIASLSSSQNATNHFTVKKSGLAVLQTLSNNSNFVVLNLNHTTALPSSNHSSVTTASSLSNNNSINTFNLNNSNENNTIYLGDVINTTATSSLENNNYLNSTTQALSSISYSPSQTTNGQQSTNEKISVNGPQPQLPDKQTLQSIFGHPSLPTDEQPNIDIITTVNNEPPILASSDASNGNNSAGSETTTCSPRTKDLSLASPSSPSDQSFGSTSNFAYEHDHDYESVGSPCSSTSSGPIYIRPAGFTHHAQEVEVPHVRNKLKKKKYLTSLVTVREGYKTREATPPKLKPKREPLPMKLRALPQSFWQQPNVAHQVSPATLFLPPLINKDSEEVMMDVRPVTPPDERDVIRKSQAPERKVIVTNTDLLFKLFDGIGEGKKVNNSFKSRAIKARKSIPRSNTKGLLMGNDPYMVDAVTEKIFPQLTLEGSRQYLGGGNTSLQLITLKEGDRTVTLPSLSLEQNYPQMLSELVLHI